MAYARLLPDFERRKIQSPDAARVWSFPRIRENSSVGMSDFQGYHRSSDARGMGHDAQPARYSV